MKLRNTFFHSVVLVMTLAALSLPVMTQDLPARGDDAKRPSKNGRTEGTIDGTDIIITYGRPNVKGRTIWGELVGYGQVWRAGANEATVIWFSRDVTIQGQKLSAGVYSLWTVPAKEEWTVIFNSQAAVWGRPYRYASSEVLRVKVKPAKLAEHVESLDFVIEGSKVMLRWENLGVPIQVASAN